MSLVQRVTPIEGTDCERNQLDHLFNGRPVGYGTISSSHLLRPNSSHQRSLRHVLSYDAIPKPEDPSQATNPTGGVTAYKVSIARRIAQVFFTVLTCWLASGVVFGFAALKPILIDQGVYRELCTAEELRTGVDVCYEQDLSNVSALPVGSILDRYGPRISAIIGSICIGISCVVLSCAFYIPEFDGYIVGNIFLALGGTFVFVPSYSIANAFPRVSGCIVATVTGAFDASAAVFLVFRLIYEASGGRLTPEIFFAGYSIIPALILVGNLVLMNEDAYKTVPQLETKLEKQKDARRDTHDSDEDMSDKEVARLRNQRRDRRVSKLKELDKLLGDAKERLQRVEREENRVEVSGVWGVLHGRSVKEQMLSPWFILITFLTVLQMLRMNFFIATIRAQYVEMLGSRELGKRINSFFDIALPIGGVAATPFIGLLLDNVSTASMLGVLVAMITAVGIAGCLPYLAAAYCNIIIFVLLRPLYYSAISDYAVKVFGFATFGRVYGCIIALSGIVNLFQPLIDAMNHDVFHDNPIPINIVLSSLGFIFGASLVVYVSVQARGKRKQQAAIFLEWDQEMLIQEEVESDYAISHLDLRDT